MVLSHASFAVVERLKVPGAAKSPSLANHEISSGQTNTASVEGFKSGSDTLLSLLL